MNRDKLLILTLLEDLQKINEKKKKLTKKQMKIAQAAPPPDEITGADFKALNKKKNNESEEDLKEILESFISLDEKKKRKKRKKKQKTDFDVGGQPQYRTGRSKKQISTQASLTRQYNNAKTEPARQRIRDKIDRTRAAEKPTKIAESSMLNSDQLSEILSEMVELKKLDIMLEKVEEIEEKRKRKKSGKSSKGLSAAVKKSLNKKADRRGLTRGSVYAEFRKGLAAYYTSGSRKGMTAHQWAHARVNSANPSKSWAVVKKKKGKKK